MHGQIDIQTHGSGLYEFTSDVSRWLRSQDDGLLTLLIQHTSASLLIQENADPEVQTDLQAYLFPDREAEMATLDHEAIQETCEVIFKFSITRDFFTQF